MELTIIIVVMYALNHLVTAAIIVLVMRDRNLQALKVERLQIELFEKYRSGFTQNDSLLLEAVRNRASPTKTRKIKS